MIYPQDTEYCTPYKTFYDSYSEHNHDKLIENPRFKKLIESVGLEFEDAEEDRNLNWSP